MLYTDRGRVVGVQIDDPSTVYSYNTSANKGGECILAASPVQAGCSEACICSVWCGASHIYWPLQTCWVGISGLSCGSCKPVRCAARVQPAVSTLRR